MTIQPLLYYFQNYLGFSFETVISNTWRSLLQNLMRVISKWTEYYINPKIFQTSDMALLNKQLNQLLSEMTLNFY